MFGRITRSSNEISAEDRVDPTDHLQVILAMSTMPLPSRWPNEAERVDGEEGHESSLDRISFWCSMGLPTIGAAG
jgi:hypothetical protein